MAQEQQVTVEVRDLAAPITVEVVDHGPARVVEVVVPVTRATVDAAVAAAVLAAAQRLANLTPDDIPGLNGALADSEGRAFLYALMFG